MYRQKLADRPTPATHDAGQRTPVVGLLDELARAMLVAAERERDRLLATVNDEANLHATRVHTRAEVEAAEFKRLAEEDIDEIQSRSAAEIDRIRLRADRRVAARRGRLDRHLIGHRTIIDEEMASVAAAVERYGRELDGFFGRLRGHRNPSHIARLANTLPPIPDFDAARSEARAAAVARLTGEPTPADPDDDDEPEPTTTAPEPEAELVGVMDPDTMERSDLAGGLTRVMRTLAAWTSSSGRGG